MSVAPGRQGVIAFFVTFCVCLVALAVALNVGWVVLTLREIVPLLVGSLVFAAILTAKLPPEKALAARDAKDTRTNA